MSAEIGVKGHLTTPLGLVPKMELRLMRVE